MKSEPIPLLNPIELSKHHFPSAAEWQPYLATFYQKFHINRIEDYWEHLRFPVEPHRNNVSDFIFLTKGKTKRSKGLDSYEFSANTFLFIPAYQITTHEYLSENAEGFYCHFDTEILNKKFIKHDIFNEFPFLQFNGNPWVTIDEEGLEAVLNILSRLENIYTKTKTESFNLISTYLLALFFELKNYVQPFQKITDNSASRITQQFKNALMQYIYEKQTISEYAGMLAVSPNHLNKCIKATTGKSAHDLLFEMLLLEAKALLKQTHLTINEIA